VVFGFSGMRMTFSVRALESVTSTNEWVSQNAAELSSNTLVFTLNQTAGKGRNGRVWASKPGDSVAFSLLLDAVPRRVFPTWIPLLAGVSVVETVRGLGVSGSVLKWPNDVLVNGAKLAGILVEVLPDSRVVVGVGVNITATKTSLPHPTATSLALQGVVVSDLEREVLQPVASTLRGYLDIARDKNPADVHSEWKKMVSTHLSTLGCGVEWEGPEGALQRGVAKQLAEDGGLVVSGLPDQADAIVRSGDVFHIERS
jgi:BirA family transcriptional regulator, biotin operon repressor / biotin---[acetyl-CoA-carboxylase] ligase